ncbi:MAG: Sterol-binding domain protein, partial [uncultured Acetobacteraceae bacterium]
GRRRKPDGRDADPRRRLAAPGLPGALRPYGHGGEHHARRHRRRHAEHRSRGRGGGGGHGAAPVLGGFGEADAGQAQPNARLLHRPAAGGGLQGRGPEARRPARRRL